MSPFFSPETRDLESVARLFGGDLARDGQFGNLGMLRNAGHDLLTVFYDEKFRPEFEAGIDRFSSVLTTKEIAPTLPESCGVLVAENPLALFFRLHLHFCRNDPGFYTKNSVAQISSDADIHPSAVLPGKNIVIGQGVVIRPHAVIEENTIIGENSFIGPGVVIGGNGFEMRSLDGALIHIPHAGGVTIGPEVHIQANSAVARALFGGATTIGAATKIDQLVHVAHAVQIGARCRLAASSCIGGATDIGDDVWIGPRAVLSNSLKIGSHAWIAMGSAVARDVPPARRVAGPFARPML